MPGLLAGRARTKADGDQRRRQTPQESAKTRYRPRSLDSSLPLQSTLAEILANPLRYETSRLQLPALKYEPINLEVPSSNINGHSSAAKTPVPSHLDCDSFPSLTKNALDESLPSSSRLSSPASKHLYQGRVPLTWPVGTRPLAAGLYNKGNTCYMNSTMQALVHTAPLTHLLLTTDLDTLKGRLGGTVKGGFDPVAALQTFTQRAIGREGKGQTRIAPQEFIKNLKSVARSFSHGRQEDAHEWLRMLLDTTQQSCLALGSTKANQSALRETTFVHKIFGGKLRSRVTCLRCKYNSDTFDPILDFSLDIRRCETLRDAMNLFTEIEELRGSEKYCCEKCKSLVNAHKHFKIEQCPNVMTVHLKRFTLTGSKISRPISFPERFKVKGDWTSSGQDGPVYKLYAVVHHYGDGPHSGHYIAQVKSPSGKWMEMNDDMVTPTMKPGHESRSAYILFYARDPKESLGQVIVSARSLKVSSPVIASTSAGTSILAHSSTSSLTTSTVARTTPLPQTMPCNSHASEEDAGELVSPRPCLENVITSGSSTAPRMHAINGSHKLKRQRSSLLSAQPSHSRFSIDDGPNCGPVSTVSGHSPNGTDFLSRSMGHKKQKQHKLDLSQASHRRVSGGLMKIKERMKPRQSI